LELVSAVVSYKVVLWDMLLGLILQKEDYTQVQNFIKCVNWLFT